MRPDSRARRNDRRASSRDGAGSDIRSWLAGVALLGVLAAFLARTPGPGTTARLILRRELAATRAAAEQLEAFYRRHRRMPRQAAELASFGGGPPLGVQVNYAATLPPKSLPSKSRAPKLQAPQPWLVRPIENPRHPGCPAHQPSIAVAAAGASSPRSVMTSPTCFLRETRVGRAAFD